MSRPLGSPLDHNPSRRPQDRPIRELEERCVTAAWGGQRSTLIPEKILFVDDEPAVLQGYQRLLHGQFKVTASVGGAAGLIMLEHQGPFAVVVSDMRMPGMDGIQFLLKVKATSPDTVRVMLTGQPDQQTAIDAVNQGSIFRFLSKPSDKETMVKTLNDAVAQYRLISAERELLEKTLRGTVYVLTEVLSLVNPAAFSRAMRVRRYVQHVAAILKLANPWKYEIAAMMSQLGCVTLDSDIIETVYAGGDLSKEDQAQYASHPKVALDLLKNIPRMEAVAWLIAQQNEETLEDAGFDKHETADLRQGALVLRAALTFDSLLRRKLSRVEAAHYLTKNFSGLDKKVIEAMVELQPEVTGQGARQARISELTNGMILDQDVRTQDGLLLAARGQDVTFALILKLKSFLAKEAIKDEFAVSLPRAA